MEALELGGYFGRVAIRNCVIPFGGLARRIIAGIKCETGGKTGFPCARDTAGSLWLIDGILPFHCTRSRGSSLVVQCWNKNLDRSLRVHMLPWSSWLMTLEAGKCTLEILAKYAERKGCVCACLQSDTRDRSRNVPDLWSIPKTSL